jgi:hypothetical protein
LNTVKGDQGPKCCLKHRRVFSAPLLSCDKGKVFPAIVTPLGGVIAILPIPILQHPEEIVVVYLL